MIKLNDGIFYVNWSQYFENLFIHNLLFEHTAYVFKGFVLINEVLYSVVEQCYVKPTSPTDIEAVKKEMFDNGFVLKKGNDYLHEQLGLIVEDLHDENVLTKDGVLFYVNTVIYLKD